MEEIREDLPVHADQAQRQADGLQELFDRRGIDVDVPARADEALVTLIVILVATIDMLLDAPRIAHFAERVGGPTAPAFLRRTERTLGSDLEAQLLVSLIIGTGAGAVLLIYGVTGPFHLGAVPPARLAPLTSPVTALWVVVALIAMHQLEGHIVVPTGIVGMLLAMPMAVFVKESVAFAIERLGLAGTAPLAEASSGPAVAATAPPAPAATPTRELRTGAIDAPELRP